MLSLLPEVLNAIPNGPPILAAGGISTGSQLAAALTLGAAGAVVGTRFLLTPESKFSGKQKELLLAAKSSDTVRTVAFDVARGTTGWPAGIDGRGLRSATVDNYDQGLSSDEVKTRFVEAKKRGDPAGYVTWSGSSIGLINEIKSADVSATKLCSFLPFNSLRRFTGNCQGITRGCCEASTEGIFLGYSQSVNNVIDCMCMFAITRPENVILL